MIKVFAALKEAPPGTVLRWDKLVQICNRSLEPSEENPDPLRMLIDIDELKKILQYVFEETGSTGSDGMTLMREYIPKMYDKHSLERGRRVSQRERETSGLTDEAYAYGEMDHETFATILIKATMSRLISSFLAPLTSFSHCFQLSLHLLFPV